LKFKIVSSGGLCVEELLINIKKIIVMVAISLDNIHNVLTSISSFVATIDINPIQHKGKGEKNQITILL
jgi:hypothetical protein